MQQRRHSGKANIVIGCDVKVVFRNLVVSRVDWRFNLSPRKVIVSAARPTTIASRNSLPVC